jgi:DNA-binding response OmpR family regulator
VTAPLEKILLVEDDPSIQAIAKMSLELVGRFTVLVCGSGADAIAKVAEFAPDLIVLDVMMPGMDGQATLRALREMPTVAAVPIVFMTAKSRGAEADALRALGAIDVVTKPFDPRTLPATLRGMWDRRDRRDRADG